MRKEDLIKNVLPAFITRRLSADAEDRRIWYKTTQVYVAGIRRSCSEAFKKTDSTEATKRDLRVEAEKGAEIIRTRRGAGRRAGASEELLSKMEKSEKLLKEAADGYAHRERLVRSLREVEDLLEKECP